MENEQASWGKVFRETFTKQLLKDSFVPGLLLTGTLMAIMLLLILAVSLPWLAGLAICLMAIGWGVNGIISDGVADGIRKSR